MRTIMNFKELKIWQEARQIVGEIYKYTAQNKDFGFNDQIQRAAISIMNNIAEGHEYRSKNMFQKFLKISMGSCGEVRSMLYLAVDLNYFDQPTSIHLLDRCKALSTSLIGVKHYQNPSIN